MPLNPLNPLNPYNLDPNDPSTYPLPGNMGGIGLGGYGAPVAQAPLDPGAGAVVVPSMPSALPSLPLPDGSGGNPYTARMSQALLAANAPLPTRDARREGRGAVLSGLAGSLLGLLSGNAAIGLGAAGAGMQGYQRGADQRFGQEMQSAVNRQKLAEAQAAQYGKLGAEFDTNATAQRRIEEQARQAEANRVQALQIAGDNRTAADKRAADALGGQNTRADKALAAAAQKTADEIKADGAAKAPAMLKAAAILPLPLQAQMVREHNARYGTNFPVPGDPSGQMVTLPGVDGSPASQKPMLNPAIPLSPEDQAAMARKANTEAETKALPAKMQETKRGHDITAMAIQGNLNLGGQRIGLETQRIRQDQEQADARLQLERDRLARQAAKDAQPKPGSDPVRQYINSQQARLKANDKIIADSDNAKNKVLTLSTYKTDNKTYQDIINAQNAKIAAAKEENARIKADLASRTPSSAPQPGPGRAGIGQSGAPGGLPAPAGMVQGGQSGQSGKGNTPHHSANQPRHQATGQFIPPRRGGSQPKTTRFKSKSGTLTITG